MKRLAFLSAFLLVLAALAHAQATTLVPPGNRSPEQPPSRAARPSARRPARPPIEAKYRKVYELLKNDSKLRSKIREAAAAYGIDPMHIVGAIVGEHTYNVDAYDRLQTYYVKAVSYLGNQLRFSYDGEDVDRLRRSGRNFPACTSAKRQLRSVDLPRSASGTVDFRGKTWTARLSERPLQRDLLPALLCRPDLRPRPAQSADRAGDERPRQPGLRPAAARRAATRSGVYKTIMDPDLTLPYVAATLKKSIDAYRSIAGFDISQNPGITATLYNVGNPEARAYALKAENERPLEQGWTPKLPEENYYGWLVNEKLPELQALF